MKFILLFLLLTNSIACSGELEKEHAPKIKMKIIERPPANSLSPQIDLNQEHISGNGKNHISGGPPSFHISAQ